MKAHGYHLDSSDLPGIAKLRLAAGVRCIQCERFSASRSDQLHRPSGRTSSDSNFSRGVSGVSKSARRKVRRKISLGPVSRSTVPRGRVHFSLVSRHFVPGRLRRIRRARQPGVCATTLCGRDVGFAESGYFRLVPSSSALRAMADRPGQDTLLVVGFSLS